MINGSFVLYSIFFKIFSVDSLAIVSIFFWNNFISFSISDFFFSSLRFNSFCSFSNLRIASGKSHSSLESARWSSPWLVAYFLPVPCVQQCHVCCSLCNWWVDLTDKIIFSHRFRDEASDAKSLSDRHRSSFCIYNWPQQHVDRIFELPDPGYV